MAYHKCHVYIIIKLPVQTDINISNYRIVRCLTVLRNLISKGFDRESFTIQRIAPISNPLGFGLFPS
jgi:hypothetical protein